MELITLKEYANSKGITYEAVRRQVSKYADTELAGHIVMKNRTQYLDEVAVDFLSNKRRESPIVLQTIDQSEEIDKLTAEIEELRAKLSAARDELLGAKDRIIALQDEARQTIEDKARYQVLLEESCGKDAKIEKLEAEIKVAEDQQAADRQEMEELRRQLDTAKAEAQSYTKSFFGFYRKR